MYFHLWQHFLFFPFCCTRFRARNFNVPPSRAKRHRSTTSSFAIKRENSAFEVGRGARLALGVYDTSRGIHIEIFLRVRVIYDAAKCGRWKEYVAVYLGDAVWKFMHVWSYAWSMGESIAVSCTPFTLDGNKGWTTVCHNVVNTSIPRNFVKFLNFQTDDRRNIA